MLFLCLSAQARAQTAAAPEAPKFLPEEVTSQELHDLAGRGFRLSDLRGRVYVLNLWATWCGPCRLEIPGFNKIYQDFRARDVEFVGLTAEDPVEDAETVRRFTRELRMAYRVGWVDGETFQRLAKWNAPQPGRAGVLGLPQTFVIAADGRVVLRVRGYNPRISEIIRAAVRQALELSPAPARPPATGREQGRQRL